MADHKKAKLHHAKAGEAFQRGDMKGAASHMGHALAALRSATSTATPPAPPADDDESLEMAPRAPKSSIRDRLAGFKKP
jgi:hypothetical protein